MIGIYKLDYVICPICGKVGKRIYKHLKKLHNIDCSDFSSKFPGYYTSCDYIKSKIRRSTKKSLNMQDVVAKRKKFRLSKEGREMARRNGSKYYNSPRFHDEHGELMRKIMTELWKDPEFRKSQIEKVRASLNTPRIHKLHHDRLVKQWKTESYRSHMVNLAVSLYHNGTIGPKKVYVNCLGNEVLLRSSWELSVYNILTTLGVTFEYESLKVDYTFEGNHRVYIPDFYTPSCNLVLEVKPDVFQKYPVNLAKKNAVVNSGYKFYFIGNKEYSDYEFIKTILSSSTTIRKL